MTFKVYSISELTSLRPERGSVSGPVTPGLALTARGKLYFSLWKRYLQHVAAEPAPVKVPAVKRKFYDLYLSNRKYVKDYVREHGHYPRFKPWREIVVPTSHVLFLEEHLKKGRALLRRIDNLRRKLFPHPPPSGGVGPVAWNRSSTLNPKRVQAKRGVNGPRQSPANPAGHGLRTAEPTFGGSKLGKTLVHVARSTGNDAFVDVLGGVVFTNTPAARQAHAKYWYFFRKRGFWHFSQHHPLGDEHGVYDPR
jgi:hypothetical protein